MSCTRQKLAVAAEYAVCVADLAALFAAPEAAPAEVAVAVAALALMVNSFQDLAECLTAEGDTANADAARRNAQTITDESAALQRRFGVAN